VKGFSHDSKSFELTQGEGGEENNIKEMDFVIYFDYETTLAVNYLQIFEFELRSHTMRA